jgi:hypothetical protein
MFRRRVTRSTTAFFVAPVMAGRRTVTALWRWRRRIRRASARQATFLIFPPAQQSAHENKNKLR